MLWETYHTVNDTKAWINKIRCGISYTRWERGWARYARKSMEESPSKNVRAKSAVYSGTMPFSVEEYVGETKRGIPDRSKGHVRKAENKGRKQMLHKKMAKMGSHKMTWTGVHMWDRPTEKFERLREEGRRIWERDASLNTLGTEKWNDRKGSSGLVMLGRRKRFRVVKRLVRKGERREEDEVQAEKKDRRDEECRKRAGLMSMLARMARRPWKDTPELKEQKTAKKIKGMSHKELKRVVRMLYDAMDSTSRSIATANLRLCLKERKDVVFSRLVIRSPAMRETSAQKTMRAWAKSWCNWWETKKEMLVILNMDITESASKSISGILENASRKGYKKEEELK